MLPTNSRDCDILKKFWLSLKAASFFDIGIESMVCHYDMQLKGMSIMVKKSSRHVLQYAIKDFVALHLIFFFIGQPNLLSR